MDGDRHRDTDIEARCRLISTVRSNLKFNIFKGGLFQKTSFIFARHGVTCPYMSDMVGTD